MSVTLPRGSRGEKRLKITVVGDATVGKTCLLISYTQNRFPEDYLPTVFDTHPMEIKVDEVEHPVNLWDSSGEEGYARLRPLSYSGTNCFIVCYSVDNPVSFANVKEKWIAEVRRYCPKAAVVILGTKLDTKADAVQSVSFKEAKSLKRRLKAQAVLECSALTRENLDSVFTEAVRAIMKPPNSDWARFCTVQ